MTTAQEIQLATDTLDKVVIPLVGLLIGWAALHFGLRQKAQSTLARQDLVGDAARTAVGAVEQQMAGAQGAAKRARAIDTATAILAARGVTVTDAEKQAIEAAIEAEVGALNRYRSPAPVVVNNRLPAVTATPGPGQEASATVQPTPTEAGETSEPPPPPPIVNDPTASKPVGAGTGVSS